ncbi:WXG100 family type VII secretion target [Mycolicibacterium litorale]|uniref:WXG100 family type VII secretion target n=1 Tax=Mycolicibacterium litorale TaxID=758802 RepID=A0AAD1MW01_9MYCO|nr:hypothetical protein [Mycolicibacterium litorale]MCV7416540.1 hypothetical protein [Mycolicibacterium litorale]TDY09791.1 hypothetical protein BCL50_1892 [Mycolicibacterium litorale]BBY17746.1 hypothetical protein MLIT_33380 [Mycolicibacterium litorale]
MLPSRTTLESWNPDALAASAGAVGAAADTVAAVVKGVDTACGRMPETRAWEGRSHDAASAMFGRANADATEFSEYAHAVATALRNGADAIGAARAALLARADQVDAGPLSVTDQWVVLIDPVRMSAEDFAEMVKLAAAEQSAINGLLTAVGDADEGMASAVSEAGGRFGFVAVSPSNEAFAIPLAPQKPQDQVPDPRNPVGMLQQEALREGDMSITVREVVESESAYGEEVTTVFMQDGSRQEITRKDPFDWPDRQEFITVEQFDKTGEEVSRSSSWHDLGSDCDYTSVTWPDGSNFTMSMDPTGYRNAGFTTAGGRHQAVPVELIDKMSLGAGAVLSGLEKHVDHGRGLPMLTARSVDDIGKAAKFGGPALGLATTVFDMVMAESGRDACIAAFGGIGGAGGGWAGAEAGAAAGAAVGAVTGPLAVGAVPLFAFGGSLLGGWKGADLGEAVGNVLCPY